MIALRIILPFLLKKIQISKFIVGWRYLREWVLLLFQYLQLFRADLIVVADVVS